MFTENSGDFCVVLEEFNEQWEANASFVRKYSIFAEFENSLKIRQCFQGFAVLPYAIKDFWVLSNRIGSQISNLIQNNIGSS